MSLFPRSPEAEALHARVSAFMDAHIYPIEARFERELEEYGPRFEMPPLFYELQQKAKAEGLWNLFLPESEYGAGLSNLDYAPIAECMGRVEWASAVFNCSAPDTGNMEVLVDALPDTDAPALIDRSGTLRYRALALNKPLRASIKTMTDRALI